MNNCESSKENADYSVLMSVYYKENPSFLDESFSSIFSQSKPTNDFVCVCDGPLTKELDDVIDKYSIVHPNIMNVVRLPENKGLGNALNIGLPLCKNNLIMRADSDDISMPSRAEKEIALIIDGDLDIVSSTVLLFSGSTTNIIGERRLPQNDDEIRSFAKKRCPYNHPSVMFRRESVLKAGGYQSLLYKEDYYLWIRMILCGSKGSNIQEPLVFMRSDNATIGRRKNKAAYKSQKSLTRYMKQHHFINCFEYTEISFLYFAQHISPPWLARFVYSHILHKKKADHD